ncbi:hypothetical protein PtA15_6A523 [Puccinia triticina]|nr:uncharacterized protein PtA15_6A523 [Puccinia triticina]WAQ85894.1 hypothetical protein PtA15_6A523 [Puccinia triticina]WAR55788.1 hypothetical protein PtB15_6B531 [Puccinia triticina]
MQAQTRPTRKPAYSATATGSAEQCFSYSTRESPLTSHSVSTLAKDASQDRLSFTPFSQHSWLDESKPQAAKGAHDCRAARQPVEAEEVAPPSDHTQSKRAFSVTSYGGNDNSTSFLPRNFHIPSSTRTLFQDHTLSEAKYATQFPEENLPPDANCSPSCQGKTTTEETRRPERQRVKLGGMSLLSSMFGYPILEPTKIHTVNLTARSLENSFCFGSLRSKMLQDQLEASRFLSRDFSKAHSLVQQGQTICMLTFGSIQFNTLPSLDELKQALRDLDASILECNFKLTNEQQCSAIWTRLEAVQDQAISVVDSLLEFGKHLSKLHSWVCERLVPACIRFYSMVQDVDRDQAGKVKENIPGATESGSALLLLNDVVGKITTAQLLVTFYHSCISSFLLSLEEFLNAIPEGEMSMEELVTWSRLCSFSVGDVRNGLTSFRNISEKIASEMMTPSQPQIN